MKHIVSVSGGKDSTATYLRALERGLPFRAVAADTGNEHPATYEAINQLGRITGGPEVEWVRADFSDRIAGKRAYVAANWLTDLQLGKPGEWIWRPDNAGVRETRLLLREWINGGREGPRPRSNGPVDKPETPADPFAGREAARPVEGGMWIWKQGYAPLSAEEAGEVVDTALTWLVPVGNPYYDLCIWKGRFPSRRAQFCTEELKVAPINDQVTKPLLLAGETVVSWQGTRAGEGGERKYYPPMQELNAQTLVPGCSGRLIVFRPLLRWSIEEVFAYADSKGVPRNPLYGYGCRRVGCFPCINASKEELALVDKVFPEQIDRLADWEEKVSRCAKRGMTTFFNIVNDPVMAEAWGWSERYGERLVLSHETHGVRQMMQWAKTDRGGRQFNLFPPDPVVSCAIDGACE